MFSVIIPTYNGWRTVDDTITTTLERFKHENDEIIVVNDGSNEITTRLLEKYKSVSNVKVIYIYKIAV